MTVIAWDGRFLAADSLQGSDGYNCHVPAVKLRPKGGAVYAITGYFAWFGAWIDWYEAGADPKDVPICRIQGGEAGHFLVFIDGGCFMFDHELPYADQQHAPDAFGSGAKYAIGAMKFGASAREAAEVSVLFDPGCGGPVQVIDLQSLKAGAA